MPDASDDCALGIKGGAFIRRLQSTPVAICIGRRAVGICLENTTYEK
jgi:hypothetical protein